jgi:hypothetical protein
MAKTSIRLTVNNELKDALDLLKRTRYPFMKDDEIFKLAFSQLFANQSVTANNITSITNILSRLRTFIPDFGKEWLKNKGLAEENVTLQDLCEMIVSYIK